MTEWGKEFIRATFIEALIAFMKVELLWLNQFPKASPLNTNTEY
jgi:PhoPQ-activated pathogenicity-related protein